MELNLLWFKKELATYRNGECNGHCWDMSTNVFKGGNERKETTQRCKNACTERLSFFVKKLISFSIVEECYLCRLFFVRLIVLRIIVRCEKESFGLTQ